jgi:hypothetical protein
MGKSHLPAETISDPAELQMRLMPIEERDASLRGVVRNGVVELLDGNLPEGRSVKIVPD